MKFTKNTLSKVEAIYTESGYTVRYEKGNFNPDYCILEQKKVVIVNKYFSTETKVNSLLSILTKLKLDKSLLTDDTRLFYEKVSQLEIKF